MTDLNPGQNGSAQPLKYNPRSKFLCHQCRHDKQACLPSDRDWYNKRQPCDRCDKLGLECSEPQRIPKIIDRTTKATVVLGQGVIDFELESSVLSTETNAIPLVEDKRSSPSLNSGTGLQSNVLAGSIHADICASGTRKLSREGTQHEAHLLIKSLGDIKAIQIHLNHDIRKTLQVELTLGLRGHDNQFSSLLRKAVESVGLQARELICNSGDLRSRDMGTYRRCFLLDLWRLMHDICSQSPARGELVESSPKIPNDLLQPDPQVQKEYYKSIEAKPHSIAEFFSSIVGDSLYMAVPSTIFAVDKSALMYQQAAKDLQPYFERLNRDIADQDDVLHPGPWCFPLIKAYNAAHLAFRTGNRQVARRLCEKGTSRYDIDVLGRTLLHYAAESNDIHTVRLLMRVDHAILTKTYPDVFGLTPVALAAMHDNIQVFKEFVWTSACNMVDRTPLLQSGNYSVLGVAARCGSEHTVRYMLGHKMFHPSCPLALDLVCAIDGRKEDLARLFVAALRNCSVLYEDQLSMAIAAAEGQHFHDLAKEINHLLRNSHDATRSDARSALATYRFEDYDPTKVVHSVTNVQDMDGYLPLPSNDPGLTNKDIVRPVDLQRPESYKENQPSGDSRLIAENTHISSQIHLPEPDNAFAFQSVPLPTQFWHSANQNSDTNSNIQPTTGFPSNECRQSDYQHPPLDYDSSQADFDYGPLTQSHSQWQSLNSYQDLGLDLIYDPP